MASYYACNRAGHLLIRTANTARRRSDSMPPLWIFFIIGSSGMMMLLTPVSAAGGCPVRRSPNRVLVAAAAPRRNATRTFEPSSADGGDATGMVVNDDEDDDFFYVAASLYPLSFCPSGKKCDRSFRVPLSPSSAPILRRSKGAKPPTLSGAASAVTAAPRSSAEWPRCTTASTAKPSETR